MSLEVKSRIRYKRGTVRTWFNCDECDLRGDYSVPSIEEANALLEQMNELHNCSAEAES